LTDRVTGQEKVELPNEGFKKELPAPLAKATEGGRMSSRKKAKLVGQLREAESRIRRRMGKSSSRETSRINKALYGRTGQKRIYESIRGDISKRLNWNLSETFDHRPLLKKGNRLWVKDLNGGGEKQGC